MKLLKQLIQISEVIQTFYQRVDKNTKSDVSPDSGVDVSVTDLPQIRKTPLVRQQSVPYYCRINQTGSLLSSATSSFDGRSHSVCKLLWNFEIGVVVSLIFSRLESIPERKQTNAQNTYIKILSLQEISFCNGLSFLRMFKGKSRWD